MGRSGEKGPDISVEKKKFVSIPDMRQSKTLLTIDERGSEIATTSVFDCQWSPVGRHMAIEKSVSNYFWSTFVDNIDIFDCHQSGVNSLYASLCYGGHFCIQLNKIIWNCLCLKGRYITMTIEHSFPYINVCQALV